MTARPDTFAVPPNRPAQPAASHKTQNTHHRNPRDTMPTEPTPLRVSLPPGANPTDPPVWRWIFTMTHHGFSAGWASTCKVLLLTGLPLGLLLVLVTITGPWWALGAGATGGSVWLRHRRRPRNTAAPSGQQRPRT
jgi:hypothetical protein